MDKICLSDYIKANFFINIAVTIVILQLYKICPIMDFAQLIMHEASFVQTDHASLQLNYLAIQ